MYTKEKGKNSMKKMFTILGFFLILINSGCSSDQVKENYEVEYGFICTNAKMPESDEKFRLPGSDNCWKINAYWDNTSGFYLRDWERDQLPSMPDLP